MFRKPAWCFSLLAVASLILAACGPTPEPQVIVETVVVEQTRIVEREGEAVTVVETVEVEVLVTPEAADADAKPAADAAGACCDVYRIAIFEDPTTINFWNYLGQGVSAFNWYVLEGSDAWLYTLADRTFQFVPCLARDLPPEPVQEGEFWVAEIEMVDDAVWSDGQPITAHDFAFTFNACLDLELTANWTYVCYPGQLAKVEATNEFTVKFTFYEKPSLGLYQYGVLLGVALPQHFWQDAVAEAYAYVDGLEAPEVEMPEEIDCTDEELGEEERQACESWRAAWDPYNEIFENARKTLYAADATGSPVAGGYTLDQLELGAFALRSANDNYYFKGAEIVEYADGTWMQVMPDGTTRQFHGNAQGEETLRYTQGPYAPHVLLTIYGSQEAAFLALADGEADYVLNPLPLSRGLKEQALQGEGIEVYTNATYEFYLVAFNMLRYPMDQYEFRQAMDVLIDKEFVIEEVLGGVVYPLYSTMPPGNVAWHNPDMPSPYVGWSRGERLDEAVRLLKEAGWSWAKEPEWSEDGQDVIPGEGLTMPDGEPMPEITVLGPGAGYDPLRATFNQWITEWARELGIPARLKLVGGYNSLLMAILAADYDLLVFGLNLGNPAFPDYFQGFWHSQGGLNFTFFSNAEYDALVDEFMSTTDLERARELVFEMQLLLADQRPQIPLYYGQKIDLARDNIIFPYTDGLGGIADSAGFQTDARPLFK